MLRTFPPWQHRPPGLNSGCRWLSPRSYAPWSTAPRCCTPWPAMAEAGRDNVSCPLKPQSPPEHTDSASTADRALGWRPEGRRGLGPLPVLEDRTWHGLITHVWARLSLRAEEKASSHSPRDSGRVLPSSAVPAALGWVTWAWGPGPPLLGGGGGAFAWPIDRRRRLCPAPSSAPCPASTRLSANRPSGASAPATAGHLSLQPRAPRMLLCVDDHARPQPLLPRPMAALARRRGRRRHTEAVAQGPRRRHRHRTASRRSQRRSLCMTTGHTRSLPRSTSLGSKIKCFCFSKPKGRHRGAAYVPAGLSLRGRGGERVPGEPAEGPSPVPGLPQSQGQQKSDNFGDESVKTSRV